ncbi:MAG TPA: DUF6077 domain-containing protein [Candidatus Binatia bacterium]
MLAGALADAASGAAIFLLPGEVVLAAASVRGRPLEQLALCFAVSLALLTAAFACCLILGTSIAAGSASLAAVTALAAVVARRIAARGAAEEIHETPGRPASFAARILFSQLLIVLCAAAVLFAPVGSIDRWWYLAYVRSYASTAVLTLAEPFLGSGQVFARFAVHPWLFGLALCSHLSATDPVAVYERMAPVLVVPAAIGAAQSLAAALFGRGSRGRLCVLATVLLWSGGLVPVLARAGEDKILAASVLFPLCVSMFLRCIRTPTRSPIDLALLALVCVATAAVHALAFAFVLVALLPFALLVAAAAPDRRRILGACGAILVVVALAPAAEGLVVRSRLDDIGADLRSPDHPVVRVHEGRERLILLDSGGYVVTPRLLLHPVALLALAGIVIAARRRSLLTPSGNAGETLAHDAVTGAYLATTTLVPLALAFVPPLPALAGSIIPPWMVYRVLWILPLAPLAAIAADAFGSRIARGERAAALLLVCLGLPGAFVAAHDHFADVRARLSPPADPDFQGLVAAVAALPPDSIIVAAPELAERLPALTGHHVLAALDRSTIVFCGSRAVGEARLRARSALLDGDPDAGALERAAAVTATHAAFDPRSRLLPRCSSVLYSAGAYALCVVDASPDPRSRVVLQSKDDKGLQTVVEAACAPAMPMTGRNPWLAAPPARACHLDLTRLHGRDDLVLRVDGATARAVDELRVAVHSTDGNAPTMLGSSRISGKGSVVVELPRLDTDSIDIEVSSSFLPVVNVRRVTVEAP